MGEELNKPIKNYNPKDNQNVYLKYGLNSIQGWKATMGDYTIDYIESNPEKILNIFGIFDGHRGNEIPKYLSLHFFDFLKNNENFKNGKYIEGLSETFLDIDKSLKTKDAQKELTKYTEEFKSLKIEEIKNIYSTREKTIDDQLTQIMAFNEILSPRNLQNSNVSDFTSSTGIVILIVDNINIFIANAGNSRCLLINKEGNIINKTKEHTMNNLEEKKRVELIRSLNEGEVKNENIKQVEYLETTRGFGDFQFKGNEWIDHEDQEISAKPDIIEVCLKDIQYIILGSHGMFEGEENDVNNKLSKFFIEEIKKDENKIYSKIIEEYFEKIIAKDKNDKKGFDNMSCIVISLTDKMQDFVKKKEKIEEERRKKEEEEIKKKLEEEERKKQELIKKMEEAKKKKEEEKKKSLEERKKVEEQKKKEEEEKKQNEKIKEKNKINDDDIKNEENKSEKNENKINE